MFGIFYFYRMSLFKNPGFVLRIGIAIAYVLLGISLFFIKNFSLIPSDTLKFALAALLIAYGIFRGYRAVKMYSDIQN